MPAINTQAGLKGVVNRIGRAFFVVDVIERREERKGLENTRHGAVQDTVASKISGCDLRLARLVDITEAEELVALPADIANLQDGMFCQFLLQVQVVIFHVRTADVLIHSEGVAHRRNIGKNRGAYSKR